MQAITKDGQTELVGKSTATGFFSSVGHREVLLNDWLFAKGGLGTYGRARNHEPLKEIQIMEREPHNAEAY